MNKNETRGEIAPLWRNIFAVARTLRKILETDTEHKRERSAEMADAFVIEVNGENELFMREIEPFRVNSEPPLETCGL